MFGLRAKRRKINPKKTFAIDYITHEGAKIPTDFILKDLSVTALVPDFPIPGMFQKDASPDSYCHKSIHIQAYGRQDAADRVASSGYRGIGALIPIEDFARMLAKIGHCMAVAALGPDKFHSFVLPYILREGKGWQYFVGSNPKKAVDKAFVPNYFDLKAEWRYDLGTNIIIADIKFISNIDSLPRYTVIVGRLLGSFEEFRSHELLPGQYERRRPIPRRQVASEFL